MNVLHRIVRRSAYSFVSIMLSQDIVYLWFSKIYSILSSFNGDSNKTQMCVSQVHVRIDLLATNEFANKSIWKSL